MPTLTLKYKYLLTIGALSINCLIPSMKQTIIPWGEAGRKQNDKYFSLRQCLLKSHYLANILGIKCSTVCQEHNRMNVAKLGHKENCFLSQRVFRMFKSTHEAWRWKAYISWRSYICCLWNNLDLVLALANLYKERRKKKTTHTKKWNQSSLFSKSNLLILRANSIVDENSQP